MPHPRSLTIVLAGVALAVLSGCSSTLLPPAMAELPPGLSDLLTGQPTTPAARERDRPRARQAARLRPYTLDLYREGDHVAQYDGSWCVGASMQMMINMMEPGRPDRTRATQARLYRHARKTSPWVESRPGASPYGWAEGLQSLGHGEYEEMAAPTLQGALRLAARQMRSTRKPVGLLVWRGAHAWVMSGFRATADPALTDDFEVTHVWVEDPYFGRVSPGWGDGLAPHTLLTPTALGRDFVRDSTRYRPQYGSRGMYVLIAPVKEPVAAA